MAHTREEIQFWKTRVEQAEAKAALADKALDDSNLWHWWEETSEEHRKAFPRARYFCHFCGQTAPFLADVKHTELCPKLAYDALEAGGAP